MIQAAQKMTQKSQAVAAQAEGSIIKYERKIADHGMYIREHGIDPPEIAEWRWVNQKQTG